MPSGSIRKKGPRPKRSLDGTGRSSSTCMSSPVEAIIRRTTDQAMGQRFFIWWLDMTRRRSRAVLVVTGLLAVLGVWLVTQVSFDANILRLLPRRAPAVRSFQTFLQTFG